MFDPPELLARYKVLETWDRPWVNYLTVTYPESESESETADGTGTGIGDEDGTGTGTGNRGGSGGGREEVLDEYASIGELYARVHGHEHVSSEGRNSTNPLLSLDSADSVMYTSTPTPTTKSSGSSTISTSTSTSMTSPSFSPPSTPSRSRSPTPTPSGSGSGSFNEKKGKKGKKGKGRKERKERKERHFISTPFGAPVSSSIFAPSDSAHISNTSSTNTSSSSPPNPTPSAPPHPNSHSHSQSHLNLSNTSLPNIPLPGSSSHWIPVPISNVPSETAAHMGIFIREQNLGYEMFVMGCAGRILEWL